MKKLLMAVAAFGMLLTSCAKDDTVAPVEDKEALVSFCVNSPAVATRYGEGETAQDLYYAVYDTQEGYVAGLSKVDGSVEIKTSTTVNLNLVQGRSYEVIFWAQAEGAPYSIEWGTAASAATMTYNPQATLTANNEAYDAFYAHVKSFEVKGAVSQTVELKRPFAQLNVATADTTLASTAGVDIATTGVEVSGVYTTLNLADDTVDGETTLTFAPTTKANGKISANGKEYDHIAMNYLLVNAKKLVDVTLTLSEDNGNAATDLTRNYTSVPVQRNYRTNIIGNILTSTADFNVEIKPGFEDDDKYGVLDGQTFVKVNTVEEFYEMFAKADYDMIILENDIVLNASATRAADATLTVSADKALTIDLNGKKLSATSTQTGKNYNMFDVRGTLTVKNGTMEYEHKGDNMAWNNFAEIFYVGFNGTLNLDGVTAKNLGGSDMAYVIDMVNATNITVNVKNSTLESTYIPIRVFNNSATGVNNVTIKNSTLKGKYCFWVQYWLADGRDEATLKQTLKLDILNGTNTFECTGAAPIIYGYNDTIYYSVVNTADELVAAFAEGGAYTLNKNIETTTSLTLANGKDVVLDLAGNTLSGVDEGTASYGLINNRGNLTINDIKGTGKIQLSATQNRGWNAYSSVISNNPGGVLVVNGGLIEHLGGTDMAYGIDNLTNGKGTSAVATINGGVVKSPYRAIRQFLNGIEATNSLTVNGGVIEGANKSIWMQDPSANANTGSLVVAAAAQLKGDVYLSVTAGSKEWPVEVSVASAALVGESTVLTSNVPVQYEVVEKDGTWVVNVKEGAVVSTAEEFTKALSEGGNVFLQENIDITKLDLTNLTNDVVIDANGKTITTQSNYGVQVTAGKNITLKNAKVEMTVEGNYMTYAAGFKIENGDYQGNTISLENCEIRMCNTDWAYAVNLPASVKNLNLVIDGCTLEGAIAVQCWGDNNTITITNSNLICNYTTSSLYSSYCVALQGDGTNNSENNTLNISGCAFSYSGVDNYNSTIWAVGNHKHNGANTITVDNCTYGEKVEAY